jgi:hypothetical protein
MSVGNNTAPKEENQQSNTHSRRNSKCQIFAACATPRQQQQQQQWKAKGKAAPLSE